MVDKEKNETVHFLLFHTSNLRKMNDGLAQDLEDQEKIRTEQEKAKQKRLAELDHTLLSVNAGVILLEYVPKPTGFFSDLFHRLCSIATSLCWDCSVPVDF